MKVKAIINFKDLLENKSRKIGDMFNVSKERAEFLLENKAIEIVEENVISEINAIAEEDMTEKQKASFEEKKREKTKKKKGRK